MHLFVGQLDRGCLVSGQNLAQRRVANRAGRLPSRVVTVEELLGHHTVPVCHIHTGERHAVEALASSLLRVVG